MPKPHNQEELQAAMMQPNVFMATAAMAAADPADAGKLRLTMYDGGVHPHWYYGQIAFDLATMSLERDVVPIMYAHYDRMGVSTRASFDGEFVLEGRWLKNNAMAASVQQDLADGFPFQSSLRFNPDTAEFQTLGKQDTAEINGHTMQGPGVIVRNAQIREGSVCEFGALLNCKTEAFHQTGVMAMADARTSGMTVDSFKADHQDIFEQVRATAFSAGQADVKDQLGAFQKAFGEDPKFLLEQFAAGHTIEQATAAQNAALKVQIAAMKATPPATAAAVVPSPVVDPAVQEFTDQAGQAPANADPKAAMRAQFEADPGRADLVTMCKGDEAKAFCVFCDVAAAQAQGRIKSVGKGA